MIGTGKLRCEPLDLGISPTRSARTSLLTDSRCWRTNDDEMAAEATFLPELSGRAPKISYPEFFIPVPIEKKPWQKLRNYA
jgi:hypothetical protein